jgi:glycosyltransferase involved in cell wall biosynthesis/uncharacterized protein (DUF362 family)
MVQTVSKRVVIIMEKQTIAVIQDKAVYCDIPPYDPSEVYPEYPFKGRPLSQVDNPGYRAVRQAFAMLGLDVEHYGAREWNPLRDIVPMGGTVVIKPNLVIDRHYGGGNLYSVITHPSIIRAVADYCRIAVGVGGRIVVADASVEDCDFAHLRQVTGLDKIAEVFNGSGVGFEIQDLRRYQSPAGERAYAFKRVPLDGDPLGDIVFDLGEKSALFGKSGPFFGSDPATKETRANHHNGVHRYCIAGTALSCDALIAIPKLKVHKKVGVTLNLKGMVGINTNKNFLVHYTLGTPKTGGDEAPDLQTVGDSTVFHARGFIRKLFFRSHNPALERLHDVLFHSVIYVSLRGLLRKVGLRQTPQGGSTYGGNWYGNDTCWRMVADIARIVLYGDREGRIRDTPQRRLFSVVDGIVGGECNGPLNPDEKPAGVVVSGVNLAAVDMVCTRLMGFDPRRLPLFRWLLAGGEHSPYPGLEDVEIVSNRDEFKNCMAGPGIYLGFEPHKNWVGHLEMRPGHERWCSEDAADTAATTEAGVKCPYVTGVSPVSQSLSVSLRVCHIVTSLRTGGMERMIFDLMGGMRAAGIPQYIFCTDEEGELYESVVAEAKFAGRRKVGLLVVDWRLLRGLCEFVRIHQISMIHAHNPVAHLYGVLASFQTGTPVVATWHGQGFHDKWRVCLLKRLLSVKTKAVVIVSEDSKRIAVDRGCVSASKAIVIPNGISTRWFTPRATIELCREAATGSNESKRSSLGVPPDAIVIGSVGRLSPEKNYSLLVRAFARVVQKKTIDQCGAPGGRTSCEPSLVPGSDKPRPPEEQSHGSMVHGLWSKVFLILVGDGPDRPVIEAEIARHNLQDQCYITGMQSEVRPWLHAMDIFCLSSDTEGLSISLLEAGACGLPSVVTDVGGNREVVNNGVEGLLVPKGDERALAEAFYRLVGDGDLRRVMGLAARRNITEKFSLTAMLDGYERVYRDVVRD